jgi:phospholipid-binding lipoprotein MlaA
MFKKFLILSLSTMLIVSSANSASDGDLVMAKNNPTEVKDCFESVNRASFAFNQVLDGVIFKPVSSVYKVLPSPVKSGVSNSLDNISNLVTIPNNVIQGDFGKAGVNTGRFILNSTIGILGIFDVAQHFGMPEYEKEDYGQSLAKLGVGPGCYIVLPVLGPSTVRDATASLASVMGGDAWYNVTVKNETQHFSEFDYYSSKVTSGIDFRAKNYDSIENLKENSIDFYASVKSLYLQDRQQKILNTQKIIDTQDDSDWEEIEN